MNSRMLMLRYPIVLLIISMVAGISTDNQHEWTAILGAIAILWGGALIIYKVIMFLVAPQKNDDKNTSNNNNIIVNVNSPKTNSESTDDSNKSSHTAQEK